MSPRLSVVISAYNEEPNLDKGVLDRMVKYLSGQSYSWEVVIVNDGSSDNTSRRLHQFAANRGKLRVIDNPHMGKAQGIITGVLAAKGELILFTDMDQATPLSDVEKLMARQDKGCDVSIGSRSGRKGAPVFRQILAYGMVILRTIILGLPYLDTQCGFKLLTREAAGRIFKLMQKLRPRKVIVGPAVDPGFDVEMLYLARKMGFKVCEVPVSWHYQETRRVRFIYDAISGIQGLLLVRWRSLTGAYRG